MSALILATGLTSEAFLPHFDGQETFGGPIFHIKDFPQNKATLGTAKSVTILGATKSAWDAAYAYSTAGVKVNWIIRSTGRGPCWMSPPYVTSLKKWIEKLANIRLLTWFSPCIFSEAGGYTGIRSFLHGTAVGRAIANRFWGVLGGDVITLMAFDKHPETAKLKSWIDAMFIGASFSILNYDTDFLDLVKQGDKITIRLGEVHHLVRAWKHVPPMKFLPEGIDKELGLPHLPLDNAPMEDLSNQQDLIKHADEEGIESKDKVMPWTPLTPYMLHHFLVPPSERFMQVRDIAFAGMVSNFSNTLTAHLQGLWIGAYSSGLLVNDPAKAIRDDAAMQKLRYDTVLYNRFGKWRYLTHWGSNIFDAVPYLDLLQRDLGLEPRRKGGVMAEIWGPYGHDGYRDINAEWLRKCGSLKKAM
ncbi:hypothetical protein PAAG_04244 [Paracoccidioides lutzii Pb01]|uniref:Uncharacterized protein n=1 Tax=Paracoccidioides lutzii (strain ATCC MYA-826 / Pb01) TaxID=502779 RepID=C1H0F0_PARBA|nr:hypothetical protein PAAG_04244 [Paracoccidioides lutzii Pb01]EEH33191.2 hypothetical protein PAAG_04244 [Paracoccidioides lutzii Pb01]